MKKSIILILLYVGYVGLGNAQTATIGTQVWSTKNLNVSTFRNGDPILEARTEDEWEQAGREGKPAWCYYENKASNDSVFGKLYNWFAVNDPRGLAPEGWHVPTDAEWKTLIDFFGGEELAGKKFKNTSGWDNYNTSGGFTVCKNCLEWKSKYLRKKTCTYCNNTQRIPIPTVTHSGNGSNESGISALPGGSRNFIGEFYMVGERGSWWSASESDAENAKAIDIWHHSDFTRSNVKYKRWGLSVRCLKD